MRKLTESEKKVIFFWIIFGLIVAVIVLIINVPVINKNNKEKEEKQKYSYKDTNILSDRNRYYTINNIITKYYSYINSSNRDALMKVLDERYINENKINEDNVLSLKSISQMVSFEPSIMCIVDVRDGIYKYVVSGSEIEMNTGNFIQNKYYEIKMDGLKMSFSIMPILENSYKEVCYE